MFDVNAEKIHCSHCNKEMNRNDKFIFIHYLFNHFPNPIINDPKCFCCVDCAKQDEPLLETFINDMVIKHRKCNMYSPNTIFFTDDIDRESEQSRMITLVKAFNLFVSKYNANKVYIELYTSLNELKKRQEKQMKD